MTANCPLNRKVSFGKPGAWNHWSIEVFKNGYEVNQMPGGDGNLSDEALAESVSRPEVVSAKPSGTI